LKTEFEQKWIINEIMDITEKMLNHHELLKML